MSKLQIFNNEEFGQVRTITVGEKVLFCGGDVAKALGYSNPRDALIRHCRCVVKHDAPHPQNPAKSMELAFIPESDIYRLIVSSKLPAAEKFEHWVFEDVLPTIRKHGIYMTDQRLQEMLMRPDTIINIALTLKREQLKNVILSEDNATMQPKADYFDALVDRNLLKGARHFCGSDWSLRSGAPHGRNYVPPCAPSSLRRGLDAKNLFYSNPPRRAGGVRGEDRVLAHEVCRECSELCHFRRNDANLETFRLLCMERGEADRVL